MIDSTRLWMPLASQYPFVREEVNVILNQQAGLTRFYEALRQLETGQRQRVTVVHVGDSHIQADVFPGTMRRSLQQQFGSAGRGLVFPYRVAHTNGPDDLRSYSNASWEARRNAISAGTLPTGISGITVRTGDPNFVLKLSLENDPTGIDNRFNKVTVFCEKGLGCHDLHVSSSYGADPVPAPVAIRTAASSGTATYHTVRSGETLGGLAAKYGCSVAALRQWNGISGSMIRVGQKLVVSNGTSEPAPVYAAPSYPASSFSDLGFIDNGYGGGGSEVYLPEMLSTIYLRGERSTPLQQRTTLYGVVLENTASRGVLYHTIGVNGAQFRNYNASEYFFDQLMQLQPDLVIVSLGTNEMLVRSFDENGFYSDADAFLRKIRDEMPYTDVLLTTPPDAYRARRYQNPAIESGKNILLNYAMGNNLACWDFYDVMGGLGAMPKWYAHRLAQPDKVHLTHSGYELQGRLLNRAIMQGYEAYKRR